MDLSPLYELRERLKTSAIAGTGLIRDDFRLQRALEALAPLEAASPVFARLGTAVRSVCAPDCADPAGALLDTLSLCDALLTTQAITKATAPEAALPVMPCGTHVQAPYSLLRPLLDALTTSGSGKYNFVLEMHKSNPALFSDYRVKPALVAALGASYAELAELVARWLMTETPAIVPLLKDGFDLKGKKEMLRRLRVIDQIAEGTENAFYLSLLETGEKEIKAAAAYALRHKEENAEVLIHLVKTEKGQPNKLAQMALATLQSPAVCAYWETAFAKNPGQAAAYMALSQTAKSSQFIGRTLSAHLAAMQASNFALTKELCATLQNLFLAVPGKSGAEICAFYTQAAALGTALDNALDENEKPYTFWTGESAHNDPLHVFSAQIPCLLTCSLIVNPTADLIQLAKQLWDTHGLRYAVPAIAAALISADSATAYTAALPLLQPDSQLLDAPNEQAESRRYLCQLLQRLHWEHNDATRPPALRITMFDFMKDEPCEFSHPLAAPLDTRWYTALLKSEGDYDPFLLVAVHPEDAAIRQAIGAYLHKRCQTIAKHIPYISVLAKLGWRDYDGLFTFFFTHVDVVVIWDVERYLSVLPVPIAEKRNGLTALLQQIMERKVKVRGSFIVENLKKLLESYTACEIAEAEQAAQKATQA